MKDLYFLPQCLDTIGWVTGRASGRTSASSKVLWGPDLTLSNLWENRSVKQQPKVVVIV